MKFTWFLLPLIILGAIYLAVRNRGGATRAADGPGAGMAAPAAGGGVAAAAGWSGSQDTRSSVFDPVPADPSRAAPVANAADPADKGTATTEYEPRPGGGVDHAAESIGDGGADAEDTAAGATGEDPNTTGGAADTVAAPEQSAAESASSEPTTDAEVSEDPGDGGSTEPNADTTDVATTEASKTTVDSDAEDSGTQDSSTQGSGTQGSGTQDSSTHDSGTQDSGTGGSTGPEDGSDSHDSTAPVKERSASDDGSLEPDRESAPSREEKQEESSEETRQPGYTTSAWSADHTVAEEGGDGERPEFDEHGEKPAAADVGDEAHEGAFDADHVAGGDDALVDEGAEASAASSDGGAADGGARDGDATPGDGDQPGGVDRREETVEVRSESNGPADSDSEGSSDERPTDTDSETDEAAAAVAADGEDGSPAPTGGHSNAGSAADSGSEGSSGSGETDFDESLRQPGDWHAADGEDPQVLTAQDADQLGLGSAATASAPSDSTDSPDEGGDSDQRHDGWTRRTSEIDEVRDGGYGVGSAATFDDHAMPLGHPVKAWEDTKSYVTPDNPHYDDAEPHVWFADAEAADRAGYHPVE